VWDFSYFKELGGAGQKGASRGQSPSLVTIQGQKMKFGARGKKSSLSGKGGNNQLEGWEEGFGDIECESRRGNERNFDSLRGVKPEKEKNP